MQTMPVPKGGYKLPSGRAAVHDDSAPTNKGKATAKAKRAVPPQFLKKGGKK